MTNYNNNIKCDIELTSVDYWDSEKECFIITLAQDWQITQKARIKDHDGVIWDCYCAGVKYYPQTDMYDVFYRVF